MKPYYERDNVTLYHGDCRAIVPTLDYDAAVVTDPPYGQTSLVWDQWCDGWLMALPFRSLWCFGTLRMFMDHAGEFKAAGFRLSQDVIWEKHNGSSFHRDRFRRVHEQPAHFYRGSWASVYKSVPTTPDATARTVRRKQRPPHMGHIESGAYESFDGGPRQMRSVMRVRSTHGYAEHPTQKPLGILLPLIENAVPSIGGCVVDPFAGVGSHLIAAAQFGARAIGVEIDERNCEISARRLDGGDLFRLPAAVDPVPRLVAEEHARE